MFRIVFVERHEWNGKNGMTEMEAVGLRILSI